MLYNSVFTFSNNVFQNMVESGNKGYLGGISEMDPIDTILFQNITFQNNAFNSDYGGGSGLWILDTSTIQFKDCKFIENVALKSPSSRKQNPSNEDYFTGDGGGIQYGFSQTISNVNMIFTNCQFKRKKAVRHGGAIALQTIQTVEIIQCTFEENVANYKVTRNDNGELLEYNNYFKLKKEGRGGAIYLNPTFSYVNNDGGNNQGSGQVIEGKMVSVKIEGCTFRSNKAFDGYAIYIEGEDKGTTFVINGNTFIDNYNAETHSLLRSVITSEILNLYEGKVVESNTFEYGDSTVQVPPLLYVDHYGNPATSSPTVSQSPTQTPTETPSQSPSQSASQSPSEVRTETPTQESSSEQKTPTPETNAPETSEKEETPIPVTSSEQKTPTPETNAPETSEEEETPIPVTSQPVLPETPTESLPQGVIIVEDKDLKDDRYDKVIEDTPETTPVKIEIKVTDFINITYNNNGGAVHIVNSGLKCDTISFKNCSSEAGAGGGIFISNTNDLRVNPITLENLDFSECKAQYGGAVYIYSSSRTSVVQILHCTFTRNVAFAPEDDAQAALYGGSALFLTIRKGKVKTNSFIDNEGPGGAVKLYNNFNRNGQTKTAKVAKDLASNKDGKEDAVIVSNCRFTISKESDCSLFHHQGNDAEYLQINDCIFDGVLAQDSHYIDGFNIDGEMPKLSVTNCKFNADLKKAFNLQRKNGKFLPYGKNIKYLESHNSLQSEKGPSNRSLKALFIPALVSLFVAFIIFIVTKKTMKNDNNENDNNENADMQIEDDSQI